MREIKFRAWDKSDKVMREVYGLLYPKISNHGNRDKFMVNMHCSDYEKQKAIILSDFERPLEEVELMQFTGLKDKNGVKIFEGDVVKCRDGLIEEIKWVDKTNWVGKCNLVGYVNHAEIYGKPVEVIGNIYENPELINPNETP